uniref:Uncharacterized protein n=1 Tax=Arundo donax TaxID=35708 RepID=A0A0A9AJ92_ARUDO
MFHCILNPLWTSYPHLYQFAVTSSHLLLQTNVLLWMLQYVMFLRVQSTVGANGMCLKKVVEVLGHLFNNHNDFLDDFNEVENHMLSKQEFEQS